MLLEELENQKQFTTKKELKNALKGVPLVKNTKVTDSGKKGVMCFYKDETGGHKYFYLPLKTKIIPLI